MSAYAFTQVDVFGSRGLDGNPLAVVHAAEGLDDEQMCGAGLVPVREDGDRLAFAAPPLTQCC